MQLTRLVNMFGFIFLSVSIIFQVFFMDPNYTENMSWGSMCWRAAASRGSVLSTPNIQAKV